MLLKKSNRKSMQRLLLSIRAPGTIHARRLSVSKHTGESARIVFRQNQLHLTQMLTGLAGEQCKFENLGNPEVRKRDKRRCTIGASRNVAARREPGEGKWC